VVRGMIYNEFMEETLLDMLKGHPVFANLPEAEMVRIAGTGILRNYLNGEIITHAGDTWDYLFLVQEGKVGALKESSEGRSFVVAELGQGEIFWGLAFFLEDISNPVTLQCTQVTSLVLWKRETLLPILLERGQLMWEISQLMVKRMLHASEVIEGLAFQPVAGRLARLLMDYPGKVNSGPTARSLTLDEMAARIGSTREMVCRFLQRFAEAGLIKITRTEFEVTDDKGLLEVAQKVKA
jgi:CRP/FNR family transcriptional regulator, cyclic AMP receptor protein